LPFINPWMGLRILWFDTLALFVGLISGLYLFRAIYLRIIKKEVLIDKLLIVASGYAFFIMVITFFFNPTWGGMTNVVSSHRYIFATPFYFIFLVRFTEYQVYKRIHFLYVFFLSTAFWLLFGSYDHIRHFILFEVDTLIIFLYMLYANKISWSSLVIMAINVLLQIGLFQIFIRGTLPE
jgi:hypothetical protein